MLSEQVATIEIRARAIAATLADAGVDVDVVPSTSSVGGGAFPTATIPSAAIALASDVTGFEKRLRHGDPPVVGRINEGKLLLDLRSVQPREDAALVRAVIRARA
jgi:L-seryl-tRNA(Ser) seleniumtransferase